MPQPPDPTRASSRRQSLGAVPYVLVAALLGILVLTSPGTTQAAWHAQVSVSLPNGQSDRFTMTATDVNSGWGARLNTPAIDITNTAERHQGAVTVAPGGITAGTWPESASLASVLQVQYRAAPADGNCANPGAPTTGFTLAPGANARVCASLITSLSERNLLLNHAGRSATVATNVSQQSTTPATWSAPTQQVQSTARVTFPQPMPWNNNMGSLSNSCVQVSRGLLLLPDAELRWAWPDGGASTSLASPAIHRWEIHRRTSSGSWQHFTTLTDSSARSLRISSGDLGPGLPGLSPYYYWRIVAFPRDGSAAYAESVHEVQTRQPLTNLFNPCLGVSANPSANPVVGFP